MIQLGTTLTLTPIGHPYPAFQLVKNVFTPFFTPFLTFHRYARTREVGLKMLLLRKRRAETQFVLSYEAISRVWTGL
jgi:hypothetical protein